MSRRSLLARVQGAPLMVQAVLLRVLCTANKHGEAQGLLYDCKRSMGLQRSEVLWALSDLEARGVLVTRVDDVRNGHDIVVATLVEDA